MINTYNNSEISAEEIEVILYKLHRCNYAPWHQVRVEICCYAVNHITWSWNDPCKCPVRDQITVKPPFPLSSAKTTPWTSCCSLFLWLPSRKNKTQPRTAHTRARPVTTETTPVERPSINISQRRFLSEKTNLTNQNPELKQLLIYCILYLIANLNNSKDVFFLFGLILQSFSLTSFFLF